MLHYNRIDVSEGIQVNETSKLKDWDKHICHYWYFLDKLFKVQPDACNGCQDVLMTSMNLAILNIRSVD